MRFVLLVAAVAGCSAEYGVSDIRAPLPDEPIPVVPSPDPDPAVPDPDPEPDPEPLPGQSHAPVAQILQPVASIEVLVGSPVVLVGRAIDPDSPQSALDVRWTSSRDGAFSGQWTATGEVTASVGLSLGAHVITFEVEDETGAIATDTVPVTVIAPAEVEVIAEPGDLIFSEMMIDPTAVPDVDGEWIELYNTSGTPIDVSGYTFHDLDYDSWVLSGPFVVPAYGYYVLCAETNPALNGGVPCDGWFSRVSLGGGIALANGVDELVLSRPDGVEVDRVAYDATWFSTGSALGLAPTMLDASLNDLASSWCDQVSVLPGVSEPGTPGQPNDPC